MHRLFLQVVESGVNFLQLDHLISRNLLLQALEVLGQIEELLRLKHLQRSLQQLVINL